jgi:hypothetical protein
MPSNPIPASISSSDLGRSDDDQLSENKPSTDPSDPQLIHEVITFKPLQGEESRSIVVSDHLIDHLSEKIKNQNLTDCVKFIRAAIETAVKFVNLQPTRLPPCTQNFPIGRRSLLIWQKFYWWQSAREGKFLSAMPNWHLIKNFGRMLRWLDRGLANLPFSAMAELKNLGKV